MDESIDEFKQNFKLIKEKKLKLAQISKFLSPSHSLLSQANTTEATNSPDNSREPKQSLSKPSLSKLNETVKEAQAQVKSKSSKLKTSKSTISNYFVSPKDVSAATVSSRPQSSSNLTTSPNSSFKCPLCSIDLTKLGEPERQKHVNECLDKDFSNKSSKNKFKLKDDAATKETDSLVSDALVASTSNSTLTPKASTTLDENAEERQKRLNENLLRDAVPNCPICGKVLQNMNVFIIF